MTPEEVYVFPASHAQQRLWFIDQLDQSGPAFNIPIALRLRGDLSVEALGRSLNEVVSRHEALRTTFAVEDGQPIQLVAVGLDLRLALTDLTNVGDPREREARARELAAEEARRPFDLARGPLLRAGLLRLGPQDHVLLLTLHHIISDGWSTGVLVRELSALYEAHAEGRPSPLEELPVQYGDYAVWQREFLESPAAARQLDYWRERLAAAPPAALELPTDRPRGPAQTYRGERLALRLPPPLTASLRDLSRREGTTVFMTLLAAFQTLLLRYTGQSRIGVGSSVAGRSRTETEGLIGFFLNTLLIQTDLSGDPSFREALARVREAGVGAYANQDVPVELLLEMLQPERNLSHNPLFQVMFIFQPPLPPLELRGLAVEVWESGTGTAKFDLTLDLTEEADAITGSLEYNTDLFDRATAGRMVEHFKTLLEGACAVPSQPLSRLPLLTDAERRLLLGEWSTSGGDYASGATIVDLWAGRVAASGDKVAAVSGGHGSLTFRELNELSDRLATLIGEIKDDPK